MTTGYLASFEPAMRLAIEQATAAGETDVPVGAVVLDAAGVVIASASNRREADGDPTAHAEIVAIRGAARSLGGWRLAGCTLVVTLEPCTMCAGAVRAGRLGRLVYGAADARAGARQRAGAAGLSGGPERGPAGSGRLCRGGVA